MHGKPVLSVDKAHRGETVWILCAWADCEKQGVTLHQSVLHDHNPGVRCDHVDARHPRFVFCSERHKQLFAHSHVAYGKLPTGSRGTIL